MFQNREQAASLLTEKLKKFKGKDVLVMAIPRGAVIMGRIVAEALSAPLDILVVRKIGAPYTPELAIGAVGPGNTVYWDRNLRKAIGASKYQSASWRTQKENEREERERFLRGKKQYPNMEGKTVLVVDDGVATGATSIVGAEFLKKKKAKRSILATPVIAQDTLSKVKRYFDQVVYLDAPEEFHAVGQFYEEFPQVSDNEVIAILRD